MRNIIKSTLMLVAMVLMLMVLYAMLLGKSTLREYVSMRRSNNRIELNTPEIRPLTVNYSTPSKNHCLLEKLFGTELPLTALASVPGSGNTWTRHLLEEITGEYDKAHNQPYLAHLIF